MPYPFFVFAALAPWTFFPNSLNQSSNSLVGNAHLITKVSEASDPDCSCSFWAPGFCDRVCYPTGNDGLLRNPADVPYSLVALLALTISCERIRGGTRVFAERRLSGHVCRQVVR